MRRARLWVFVVGIVGALLWGWLLHEPAPVETVASEGAAPRVVPKRALAEKADGTVRRDVVLMGTAFVLVVDAPVEAATPAIDAAIARLEALDLAISSWRPGSEVSAINARAGGEPVEVGDDTWALLERAQALHTATDGALDVTIGPVWDLWPFRDATKPIPGRKALDEAMALTGVREIELREHEGRRTARLARAGMRLNLGAIGKGYAARLAMDVLASHGIERAAVSAGGDLLLRGRKQSGPWVVAVEHPRWPGRALERFVAGDIAVASSGVSQRRIERDGKSYGHILDPRTGAPARGSLSVTVLTADPVDADAFATSVFVMGPDAGMAWVEARPGVEALVVDEAGRVHRSSGWGAATGRVRPREVAREQRPAPARTKPARQRTTPKAVRPAAPGSEPVRVDRLEVTNLEYRGFLEATRADADPHRHCHPEEPADKDHTPRYWRADWQPALLRDNGTAALQPFDLETFKRPHHPVVGVDWWDARAYARWAGKRLPSREEWREAAAGDEERAWPWGDDWDPKRVNAGGEKWGEKDGHIYAAPAESFPGGASPTGALHMAGNVAEWTDEGFVAGGSSRSVPSDTRTAAGRLRPPGYRAFDVGFRCASGVTP